MWTQGKKGEWGELGVTGTDMNTLLSAIVLTPFSCVRLFGTPWTVALQAPLSMGFCRQEYWSTGVLLPCPPLGDLPHPEIKPTSLMPPAFQVGSLPLALPGKLETLLCSSGKSTQCSLVT